jgi:putative glutamine amidotransferase
METESEEVVATRIPKIFCPCAKMHIKTDRLYVNGSYASAVNRSGGLLFMSSIYSGKEELESLIAMADGILIQGGCDIHPKTYGQEAIIDTSGTDPGRDETELRTLKIAIERKIPTLAICRGMQMLNILMGGDLHQDLPRAMQSLHNHAANVDRTFRAHTIEVRSDSILHRAMNKRSLSVNSIHHQGINRLGASLRVSAFSPDGLVEAIELENHPFLVGVQWHPEELLAESKPLFDAFVASL